MNFYDQRVNALILFVKALRVKVNSSSINKTLKDHPEFPSLLSLSDSLNTWNIQNIAIQANKSKINELNTPFLALIRTSKDELVAVINKVDEESVYFKTQFEKKDNVISLKDFNEIWDGIAILAEKNESSGEKNYQLVKRKQTLNKITFLGVVVLFILLGFLPIINLINSNISNSNLVIGYTSLVFIKFIGIITTILLIWYQIDKNKSFVQKICASIAKGDCKTVLDSDQAKFLGVISWSDIGFIYFLGSFIALSEVNIFTINIISVLTWLNIFALPFIFYSIYFQLRIAKRWCFLCLTVLVLLIFEFLIAIGFSLISTLNFDNYYMVLKILTAFLIAVFTLVYIKPILIELFELKNSYKNISRFKFSKEIFTNLLEKQKKVLFSPQSLGITIGNLESENTLTCVVSPYCAPCSEAFNNILSLLKNISNLKVQIIFYAGNNSDAMLVVECLLAIDRGSDKQIIMAALENWYLGTEKNYNQFVAKYQINTNSENNKLQIVSMNNWCNNMKIEGTPTIFFNGYQLPDIYHITDLRYILSNE